MVEAADALQTLFRATLTPGVGVLGKCPNLHKLLNFLHKLSKICMLQAHFCVNYTDESFKGLLAMNIFLFFQGPIL